MSTPTVATMSAAIQRRCKGKVPYLQILDAINDKNLEIHQMYEWPWTKAEYNIPVASPYTTGTISVTDGTKIVTGTNTVWDITWQYKRIYLGTKNVDFLVKSVDGPNQLTLYDNVNLGQNLVNQSYNLFQDIYPVPDNCQTILLIVNPIMRYRLKYVPTYTLQWQNVFSRVFFSNFQTGFCDGSYVDETKKTTIQMSPAPGSVAEYRLVYRRRPPDLDSLADQPIIPADYCRALELLAEYQVRFECGLPGWMDAKDAGYAMVKSMRRKHAMAPMYDTYMSYWQYPYYDQSSIFAGGLFVGPTHA